MSIHVPSGSQRTDILGAGDRNLKLVREALNIRTVSREGMLRLIGDRASVMAARDVFRALADAAEHGRTLNRQQIHDLIGEALADAEDGARPRFENEDDAALSDPDTGPAWTDTLNVYAGGKPVKVKTDNQRIYLEAIRDFDVVFGVGPAGTGKTYLAVAAAVHLLKSGRAKKIILVRPAVEAGEKLGFLPGDMQQKVNPYLRPLLDALSDMIDYNTLSRFVASDVIEIVPLAFMRGRTLNRAVIILDEAQNTTRTQMKMFLTRMGMGSKVIVTGDPTQVDLPGSESSGLNDAMRVLHRTRGIAFCGFDERDIVRHELVQRIVEAYGASDKTAARRGGTGPRAARPPRPRSVPASTPMPEEPAGPPRPETDGLAPSRDE